MGVTDDWLCSAVMALKDYTTTADGIEMQLGANHIGHFLFTNLVMDKIFAAGKGARIVNVSSLGYMSGGVHFDDYNFKVSLRSSANTSKNRAPLMCLIRMVNRTTRG